MGLDVPGGHPPGHEADDQVVEPRQTSLMLGDKGRFEAGLTVPWHLKGDAAGVGHHRLRIRPVAEIPRSPPGGVSPLIAEMMGHLRLQGPIHDPRRQLGQHPIGSQQLETLGVDLAHQPIQCLVVDQRGCRHPNRVLTDGTSVGPLGRPSTLRTGRGWAKEAIAARLSPPDLKVVLGEDTQMRRRRLSDLLL